MRCRVWLWSGVIGGLFDRVLWIDRICWFLWLSWVGWLPRFHWFYWFYRLWLWVDRCHNGFFFRRFTGFRLVLALFCDVFEGGALVGMRT